MTALLAVLLLLVLVAATLYLLDRFGPAEGSADPWS